MPRSIILGVVGDSAAGKTKIARNLAHRGEQWVTHIALDGGERRRPSRRDTTL